MNRRPLWISSFLLVAVLSMPTATASVPDTGLVWAPQSVRFPVNPDDVLPAPPFVAAQVGETDGAVQIGPGKGAAFFLDGLEIARVRVLSGTGTPRFRRVFGGSRSSAQTGLKATIDTGAERDKDGNYQVVEPPGDGDVWCVDADAPITVQIEHPRTLSGRMAWEDARSSVLRAIQADTPMPHLPGDDSSAELEATLTAQAALGADIVARRPDLAEAVRAWRTAAALRDLDAMRPFAWPYWQLDEVDDGSSGPTEKLYRVDGENASTAAWRRTEAGAAPVEVELEGPGLLRVQSRGLLQPSWLVAPAPTTVQVLRDGVLAQKLVYTGRPARVTDAANAAFPVREPIVTRTGELAGKINELRVPLAPGVHRYRIAVDQLALLRISRAERRSFLAEGISGTATADDWAARGAEALGAITGAEADLVRGLLNDVQGLPPTVRPASMSPALDVVSDYLGASHGMLDPAAQMTRWTGALGGATPPAWSWWMRVQLARLVPEGDGVRALFAAAPDLPPAGLIAPAATRLGAPGLYQDRPDRSVAAMERAWRALPADIGVRSAYLREFLDGSSWSRLSPVVLVNGDAFTPPPLTWLDTAAGTGGPVSRASRVYYRIPGGANRTYALPPSPADAAAPALLSVLLRTPPDSAIVNLGVDNRTFRILPLSDVERLDLAVPAGSHSITLGAPTGTDAWVSGVPTDPMWAQPEDLATVRSYWPTTIRNGVPHFELPSPQVQAPVRVEIRSLDPSAHPAPVVAHVRTDTGADWPVLLTPGTPDLTLLPIGGEPQLSSVATVTAYVPMGTQQLWVDAPPEANLVVSMSVRRTEFTPPATLAGISNVSSLSELTAVSRSLLASPADPKLLLRRAEVLTDLGDTDMARQDLRRLLRLQNTAFETLGDAAIDTLAERIENTNSSRWFPAALDLASVRAPTALTASLIVNDDVAPTAAQVDVVRQLRTAGAAAALPAAESLPESSVATFWIRSRILHALDRDIDAAASLIEAWRVTGRWPYALDAASGLVASEVGSSQAPVDGSGSMAYGLASELRGAIEHPTVDRLALLSGRRTRWDALRNADTSAGRARVRSLEAATPLLPQAEVRQAMTVAPWPAGDGQFATAKEPAVLSVPDGAPVLADVWCQPLRAGDAATGDAPCAVELSIDGVSVSRQTVPASSTATLTTPTMAPGRHDLQVAIDDPSRVSALSVRFRDSSTRGAVIRPERETAGFLATAAQPYAVTVAGPGTVFLETRSVDGRGGAADITVSDGTTTLPQPAVTLPSVIDRSVQANAGTMLALGGAARSFVVLPTAGSWTIRVKPRNGTALVRGAFRQETAPPNVVRPGPMWRDIPSTAEPFEWLVATSESAAPAAGTQPMAWGLGTFSLDVNYGREETDGATTAGVDQLTSALAWRLQAIPRQLWLHVEGFVRDAGVGTQAFGVDADVLGRWLATDLRLNLTGRYAQEPVAAESISGGRFTARVYRPIPVAGTYLIPSLTAAVRSVGGVAAEGPVGVDVYSPYARAHGFGLAPELMAWAMPYQDVVAYVSAGAVTNANVVSLDQVALTAVGRAVVHPHGIPPLQVEARYRPTYRFADADRPVGGVQHALSADLAASIRLGPPMLLWLGIGDTAYLDAAGTQNVLRANVRLDFSGGRGLADRLPVEQDFSDLLAGERWGALDEDRL